MYREPAQLQGNIVLCLRKAGKLSSETNLSKLNILE